MEQTVFTGIRPLYSSVKGSPNEIEIRIRMRDLIDPSALRTAVDMTMKRYPYFCVELQKKNGQYVEAFLKELEDNGITYDLQDVMKLELPNIKLPWSE